MTSFEYLQRAPNFGKQIWLLLSWTFYNVYAQPENLRGVKLKKEQEQAVLTLIEKKDVFAILPTGFGKSLIYQSYCAAKNAIDSVMPAVIVVVPLRSIAEEQVRNYYFLFPGRTFPLAVSVRKRDAGD